MKKALAAVLMLFASTSAWAEPVSLGAIPNSDDMNTLFGLPIGIIIFLLIILIANKDFINIGRALIISVIVANIITVVISLSFGIIAILFILLFSVWIAAVSLIIGTVVSALITWSRGSEPPPPPQKATFTLKKPSADENDKESDNEK